MVAWGDAPRQSIPMRPQFVARPVSNQQQKADDVRLSRAGGSCVVVALQGEVKSPDFIALEEAGELGAEVLYRTQYDDGFTGLI